MYLNNIKRFVYKENFDFEGDHVNLYNFHPQLRVFLAMKGLFFNNRDSLIRLIWPLICTMLATVGIVFEGMFTWHSLETEEYDLATETFCYCVIVSSVPAVYFGILTNRQKIYDIVEAMNEDFVFICSLGSRYKKPFLEGQLLIWQLCIAWFAFVCPVGSLYFIQPVTALVYQCLFATQDEHTTRPSLYPLWLPNDDPYRTPLYEIFMVIQLSMLLTFIQSFCVYVYTLFHILLHYNLILHMMILAFEVIFEDLDESVARMPREAPSRIAVQRTINRRIGIIVKWHLSVLKAVKSVSTAYGPALVYQVLFSSVVICVIIYQIAEKLNQGKLDILFCLLGIATCIQVLIPCYLGTLLRDKAFAMGDACFNCGWQESRLGPMLRPHIMFIIMRSQVPLVIKYTGLPAMQMETFSSVMTSAYSYFNMLWQYSH